MMSAVSRFSNGYDCGLRHRRSACSRHRIRLGWAALAFDSRKRPSARFMSPPRGLQPLAHASPAPMKASTASLTHRIDASVLLCCNAVRTDRHVHGTRPPTVRGPSGHPLGRVMRTGLDYHQPDRVRRRKCSGAASGRQRHPGFLLTCAHVTATTLPTALKFADGLPRDCRGQMERYDSPECSHNGGHVKSRCIHKGGTG